MAEISQADSGKGGKKRSKKQSTKIDMTPMVDLGFLLITFFMLTTTLQKPQTMQLNMPDDTDKKETMPLKMSESITVTPQEGGRLYWYQGVSTDPATKVEATNYSDKGLRQVLLEQKAKIGDKFTIVLKPMKKSNYKNVVDILDEMAINVLKKYALVDISEGEAALVKISDASGSAGAGASN